MTLSIRWKVAIGMLLSVTSGVVIVGAMAIQSLERQYLTQLNDLLDAKTRLVEYRLQPLFPPSSPIPVSPRLQEAVRDLGNRTAARITLVAADGTVLADSAVRDADLSTIDNHRGKPEIVQALAAGYGEDIRTNASTGERTVYRATLMTQPPGAQPIVVRIALPMVQFDRDIAQFWRNLVGALAGALLVIALLSLWLARSIAKPLSDLAQATRQLASDRRIAPIKTTVHDEVGLLAAALNDLASQLHARIDELSEDRAQLLAMLTSMVEGVMVLDSRSHVLQINPALERMFGVSRTEARGRPCAELFRHQELNDLVMSALRSRTNHEGEIVLPLTGRCLHIEISVAGGERENEACVVLVFHDMTELRRLENIRKDFVANVSHELRTPLTSIKGYVEALLDGAKDDPAASAQFLDIILKQSDRLNLIIEDLLELSKIESGLVLLKEEPVDLRSIIERALSTIKPIADKKGHRLVASIDDSLPPVAGDEGRLTQVLTNLLDNAVKYTPAGGTIIVNSRLVDGTGADGTSDRAIELTVSDTGIGIPEQDRPRVFERFYRVDKARSRELGGTGLGLAIVKHIVEGHGGQVWVEANHPHGSKFVVRLPIRSRRE
jgi:two-component system, OmpR family, phosphate regulon sensor histidine kinase PhoR